MKAIAVLCDQCRDFSHVRTRLVTACLRLLYIEFGGDSASKALPRQFNCLAERTQCIARYVKAVLIGGQCEISGSQFGDQRGLRRVSCALPGEISLLRGAFQITPSTNEINFQRRHTGLYRLDVQYPADAVCHSAPC